MEAQKGGYKCLRKSPHDVTKSLYTQKTGSSERRHPQVRGWGFIPNHVPRRLEKCMAGHFPMPFGWN